MGATLAHPARPTGQAAKESLEVRMTQRMLSRPGAARPTRLAVAIQVLGMAGSLGLLSSNPALAESPQPKANEPTQEMPRGQSSGSANPQNLDTHRDKNGDVRSDDGEKVRQKRNEQNNRQQPSGSSEHSHEGGTTDRPPGSTEP